MDTYTYKADVEWIGARRTILKTDAGDLEVSSPPEFWGPEGKFCPETLFPGILASCLLTTFLEFRERMGIDLKEWKSEATAELGPSPEKGFRFQRIRIHVKLRVSEQDKEKIPRAMELAHKYCFISRAIKNNVEEIVDYEFI